MGFDVGFIGFDGDFKRFWVDLSCLMGILGVILMDFVIVPFF